MLFDNPQREEVSKREGYLCFFLSRSLRFSCIPYRGLMTRTNGGSGVFLVTRRFERLGAFESWFKVLTRAAHYPPPWGPTGNFIPSGATQAPPRSVDDLIRKFWKWCNIVIPKLINSQI
jgi:hypothetical protein